MAANGQRDHGNSMEDDSSYKLVGDNMQDKKATIYFAQHKMKTLTAYYQHHLFQLWQLNTVNPTRAQSEETVMS